MTSQPTDRPRRRFAFLARPGWLTAIVGALAFTAACWLILAPWQFSRHAERDAQNAAIDAALNADPVPAEDFLSVAHEPAPDAIWRRVTATGTFDPAGQVYVRLRQDNDGNPAAEVVVPLRLSDGGVLLVDRGYVPDADVRAGRAAPDLPTGPVTVTGRVQDDQPDPSHRKPVVQLGLKNVYGIESAALAGDSDQIRQGFIQLVAGTPGSLAEIGVPQTDDGPFLSYALQWCAFGGMSLLALGYFVFREATNPLGPDGRAYDSPGQNVRTADHPDVAVPGGAHARSPDDPDARSADDPDARSTRTSRPPRSSPDAANAPSPEPVGSGISGRKSRSRGGFDKSQLYD